MWIFYLLFVVCVASVIVNNVRRLMAAFDLT